MTLATVLCAVLVLIAFSGTDAARRKLNRPPQSENNQQQLNPDKRGTPESPLIVKTIPEEKSPKDIQREKEERKFARKTVEMTANLVSYTWYLFIATSVLATVTFGLVLVAFFQMSEGRAAIKAAIDSANAATKIATATRRQADAADRHFTIIERPYLYISAINTTIFPISGADAIVYRARGNPSPFRIRVNFEISNYGRTPGIFRYIVLIPINIPPMPDTPVYEHDLRQRFIANIPIAALGHEDQEIIFEEWQQEEGARLLIFGRVRYTDPAGNRHVLGFGFMKLHPIRPTMHPYGGAAYNYQRQDDSIYEPESATELPENPPLTG
jgi:hypothetical protein